MMKTDKTCIVYPAHTDAPTTNPEWIRYRYDFVDGFETVTWVTNGVWFGPRWRW